jgi:hypothetical protein
MKIPNIEVNLPNKADFLVETAKFSYVFEIWWENKKRKKTYPKNTYLIKDDIEISSDEKIIPLWLFGFLS